MIEDMERNGLIVRDVIDSLVREGFPLILTERREHLEILTKLLEDKVEVLFQLHGGVRQKRGEKPLRK